MKIRGIILRVARHGTWIGCIFLVFFFYSWNPNFGSLNNISNIGEAMAAIGIIAIPLGLLVIAGGVDLSVGSVASLSGVVAALVMTATGSSMLGVAAGLGIGFLAGVTNGVLVAYFKLNSIVITLGALSVWGGMALILSGGRTVAGLPSDFTMLGGFRIWGFSLDVLLLLLAIVYGVVVLNILPYGRKLRAVGGSTRSAFLMGVPVEREQFLMFVQVGIAASLAGVILAAKLAAATPITGQGMEITALTVVLLGGVAFSGGIGTISGILAGLLFVGLLRNGLIFTGTSQFLQQILIGFTLIVAVAFDETVRRISNNPTSWSGLSRSEDPKAKPKPK